MASDAATTHRNRRGIGGFFRNPETGQLAVVQVPNLPLWVFLAATVVRWVTRPAGTAGTALSIVSGVALGIWSVLEIARGDSPFRRVLGAVVLVGMVVGLILGSS